jgi:ectoine hydroxylase-related dioxygenase (phytanoyl-CoA dioxygenase family)
MSARVLGQHEIDRFHREGFLSIPQITTLEEVARIRALYDRLFEQRAGWDRGDFFDFAGLDEPGQTASVPQLSDPSKYEPALKNTIFRTNAHAIAKQLLGPTAKLVFEHAMLKPAGTGGETPWHQDEAFYPRFTDYRSITFWMPLQPVDIVNGCLDFIPGSNNGPLLRHQSINNDPRIHGLEAPEADARLKVSCPLQEGGATVHGYRTLHHAGPNLSDGPRRAYALGFGVRSRSYIQRTDLAWNLEKATARASRANSSLGPLERYVKELKHSVKAVIR